MITYAGLLTRSLKKDRKKIECYYSSMLEIEYKQLNRELVALSNLVQKEVSDVASKSSIYGQSSTFQLGIDLLDSMTAISIAQKISQRFQVQVPPTLLYSPHPLSSVIDHLVCMGVGLDAINHCEMQGRCQSINGECEEMKEDLGSLGMPHFFSVIQLGKVL